MVIVGKLQLCRCYELFWDERWKALLSPNLVSINAHFASPATCFALLASNLLRIILLIPLSLEKEFVTSLQQCSTPIDYLLDPFPARQGLKKVLDRRREGKKANATATAERPPDQTGVEKKNDEDNAHVEKKKDEDNVHVQKKKDDEDACDALACLDDVCNVQVDEEIGLKK